MNDVNRLDFLARYCRPSSVMNGIPDENAFWIKPTEEYLSVNALPKDLGMEAGLAQIRRILAKKGFKTRPNGRLQSSTRDASCNAYENPEAWMSE